MTDVARELALAFERLTPRQRRFVMELPRAASLTDAARRAGYGAAGARVRAHDCVNNRNVQRVLSLMGQAAGQQAGEAVASMVEIAAWWTSIMRGETNARLRDRLEASRYLARHHAGGFGPAQSTVTYQQLVVAADQLAAMYSVEELRAMREVLGAGEDGQSCSSQASR
ncbi:MAG: hypothetical protein Kow0010_10950 [Dehalococcoidia bacterium]